VIQLVIDLHARHRILLPTLPESRGSQIVYRGRTITRRTLHIDVTGPAPNRFLRPRTHGHAMVGNDPRTHPGTGLRTVGLREPEPSPPGLLVGCDRG
jgi:hypothetical protein